MNWKFVIIDHAPEFMAAIFLLFGTYLNVSKKDKRHPDLALFAWSVSSLWAMEIFASKGLWILFVMHCGLIFVQMREYRHRKLKWS